MSVFDRLAAGIDSIGRRAGQALDEGKLRMELLRERRRKDNTARDLGYVVYAQSRGTAPAEGEIDGLTRRIADAEAEIGRIEARIQEVRARGTAEGRPAPAAPAGDPAAPDAPAEPPPPPNA